MQLTPDELAWSLRHHLRYAADAEGHEHKGKGPGGGQFTGHGEGQSPDAMAAKIGKPKSSGQHTKVVSTDVDLRNIPEGVKGAIVPFQVTGDEGNGVAVSQEKVQPLDDGKNPAKVDDKTYEGILGLIKTFWDNGLALGDFAPENLAYHNGQLKVIDLDSFQPIEDSGFESPDELVSAAQSWFKRGKANYAADASGHEHAPAGRPEGGQFTGKAEHGQSPDQMAAKLGKGKPVSRDSMIDELVDAGAIPSDDDALEAMTDQQVNEAYSKFKGVKQPVAQPTPQAQSQQAAPVPKPIAPVVQQPQVKPQQAAPQVAPVQTPKPAVAQPPQAVAQKPIQQAKAQPTAKPKSAADAILGLAGQEAGYAHGGATMTSSYKIGEMLNKEKFAGNITGDAIASVLEESGAIGEKVGADGRLRIEIRNPQLVSSLIAAAKTGKHNGLPVTNSMHLRRAAQG